MSSIPLFSDVRHFLTTAEAAALLRLSPRTLEKRRIDGGGPCYRKFGRRVVYARVDLESWVDAQACAMTCDVLVQR